MVTELTFDARPINVLKLHEELEAAIGADFAGISTSPGKLRVLLRLADPEAVRATVEAALATHDPAALTTDQQDAAESDTARDTLRQQVAARIAWHEANPVTDTASAVAALQRMQTEWVLMLKYMRRQL